jgi:hypothetical protein
VKIFRGGSKPKSNFDYLLPDGNAPDSSSRKAVSNCLRALAIDSEEKSVLYPVDSDAWIKASSELEVSGFRQDISTESTPIAYARVSIRGVDEDKDIVTGLAVLTRTFLTLHWKHRAESRGWKYFHDEIIGVDVSSASSVYLHYGKSIRKTDDRFLEMGETTIEVTLLLGKDRHENRRALTFWMTLAHLLSQKLPGVYFLELD